MISPIDHVLATLQLQPRPYTEDALDAAEIRVATRVAERVWYGALSFDDELRQAREEADGARSTSRPVPPADRPLPPGTHGMMSEAARDLRTLCRTVVGQAGALHQMSAFLGRRVPEPDGARVLGCVLSLAAREDGARFWWQFAAGAGDAAACYCLYLHHLALGELREAEWWQQQTCSGVDLPEAVRHPVHPAADDPPPEQQQMDRHDLLLALRLLNMLRGERWRVPAATTAVIDYVPGAVRFVDEIELPLPTPDFAQRIEELTALGA